MIGEGEEVAEFPVVTTPEYISSCKVRELPCVSHKQSLRQL